MLEANAKLPNDAFEARRRERFRAFNRLGGKFRIAVTNVCNLDCFFCHNEAMENPRRASAHAAPRQALRVLRPTLDDEAVLALVEAWASLGGAQVNLTGGEPLAHPRIVPLLRALRRGSTRTVLNTNAILAERLLSEPKLPTLDAVFASLHTVDDAQFREEFGGRSAREVRDNIVALRRHGYEVQVNYSLGPHNLAQFEAVLDFVLDAQIDLKAITLVRPTDEERFYRGAWVDPQALERLLAARGAVYVREEDTVGGHKTTWRVKASTVLVKNIGRGRFRTEFCDECAHSQRCGEGIYGLRVGVDGIFKPCLLRRDRFAAADPTRSWTEQLLEHVDAMMGDERLATFVSGAPL